MALKDGSYTVDALTKASIHPACVATGRTAVRVAASHAAAALATTALASPCGRSCAAVPRPPPRPPQTATAAPDRHRRPRPPPPPQTAVRAPTQAKGEMEAFLASKEKLAQTRGYLARSDLSEAERATLAIFERTFGTPRVSETHGFARPFTRCACEQAATSWSPRLRSPCARSAPRSRARSRTRATRCGSARCSTAPRSESRLVGRRQGLLGRVPEPSSQAPSSSCRPWACARRCASTGARRRARPAGRGCARLASS